MEIVPILSTVILIATVITLVVAIASYMTFRIKEKRREARAVAALKQKKMEGGEASPPEVRMQGDDDHEQHPHTRREGDRRQDDRRTMETAPPEPLDPQLIPRQDDRRIDLRRDNQLYGAPAAQPAPSDVHFEDKLQYSDTRQDARMEVNPQYEAETPREELPEIAEDGVEEEARLGTVERKPLSSAQAAFADSLDLPDEELELPGAKPKTSKQKPSPGTPDSDEDRMKLRRFTIPGADASKSGSKRTGNDKSDWK